MIKDFRYVIKRILIGVGIVLVLSYVGKGKASALTWDDMEPVAYTHANSSGLDIYVYYDSTSDRYYYYTSNYPNDYSRYTEHASRLPYVTLLWNYSNNWNNVYLTSEPLYYDHNFSIQGYNSYRTSLDVNSVDVMLVTICPRTNNSNCSLGTVSNYQYYQNTQNHLINYWDNVNNDPWRSSNYNVYNISNNDLFHNATYNIVPGVSPNFLCFNQTKILVDNVITGYNFLPEFNTFDTDNYDYQYKFGFQSTWTNLTQNRQLISTKNNTTLYIRIVKKSDSSIIDSSTFTINNIGQVDNNYNYNIIFSSTYENQENSINIIEEKVNIKYLPNSSTYRYQYKFFTENQNPDNIEWTTSATNEISYTSNVNGTLIARITDSQYNELYSATYDISIIGKLAINNGISSNSNFWTNLTSRINYGGPISSLIQIPINLLSVFIDIAVSPVLTCQPYDLGSLLGTHLYIPCVNVKHYLGNDLYTLIDLICSSVMFYYIIKMLISMYNGFMNFKDSPGNDIEDRR